MQRLQINNNNLLKSNDAVCYHGYYPSKADDERIVSKFIYANLAEYNNKGKWGRDLTTALEGADKATFERYYAAVWGSLAS